MLLISTPWDKYKAADVESVDVSERGLIQEKLFWKLLSVIIEDNCINVWCYLRFLVGWEGLLEVLQVQDFEHLQIIHVSPYGGFYLVLTPTERSQIKAGDDGIRLCSWGLAWMLHIHILAWAQTDLTYPHSYSQPSAQIKANLMSFLNWKCSRIMWASAAHHLWQVWLESTCGDVGLDTHASL